MELTRVCVSVGPSRPEDGTTMTSTDSATTIQTKQGDGGAVGPHAVAGDVQLADRRAGAHGAVEGGDRGMCGGGMYTPGEEEVCIREVVCGRGGDRSSAFPSLHTHTPEKNHFTLHPSTHHHRKTPGPLRPPAPGFDARRDYVHRVGGMCLFVRDEHAWLSVCGGGRPHTTIDQPI